MTDLLGVPLSILVPSALGVYALSFIAGGIYYLEQRVSRLHDQFPRLGAISRIVGYAALSIGLLSATSVAGHWAFPTSDARMGALVAVVAGTTFWVLRIHVDLTPFDRIRDGLLATVCAGLSVLTYWWTLGA